MIRDLAAKRYAQALFDAVRERGLLDATEDDMRSLRVIAVTPGVLEFLSSARTPPKAKEEFLQRALGQPSEMVWNVLRLLVERDRLPILPQIVEAFGELADEERGIAHAEVTTAVAMSDSEREAIANRLSQLTQRHVDVQAFEDPEILGGLIARVGDQLIDGSTRTKLIGLKRQLAGQTR